MPHCVIDYTSDILSDSCTAEDLVKATYEGALASDLFDKSHIKVRATRFDHFYCGSGSHGQIHVMVRIMPGRTVAQKQQLSKAVIERLEAIAPHIDNISVDVKDLTQDVYMKKAH